MRAATVETVLLLMVLLIFFARVINSAGKPISAAFRKTRKGSLFPVSGSVAEAAMTSILRGEPPTKF
jgi:hypothetical protein